MITPSRLTPIGVRATVRRESRFAEVEVVKAKKEPTSASLPVDPLFPTLSVLDFSSRLRLPLLGYPGVRAWEPVNALRAVGNETDQGDE